MLNITDFCYEIRNDNVSKRFDFEKSRVGDS